MDWLAGHTLLPADGWILLLALFGAMCIGLSKAGLAGTATLNVVLMAKIFGAKASVGLVLPLLIVADFLGFLLNRKGGSWRQILPMVPPAIAGVVLGWWLLDRIDNNVARVTIGWIILALLGFNLVLRRKRAELLELTRHRTFSWGMGFLSGTVTMLANAAGPVMTVFLLSQRLEKKEHLGVFCRFFLFINLFKLPFSRSAGIITAPSLATNLVLLPGVVLGILLGWQILKRIQQDAFEGTLAWLTAFAAAWLIVG
ncbi:sulfite exporter TauE/SafE family protein [bacterium]|nr:sulfite exporter TauE/SafE family protein [bacterium]